MLSEAVVLEDARRIGEGVKCVRAEGGERGTEEEVR